MRRKPDHSGLEAHNWFGLAADTGEADDGPEQYRPIRLTVTGDRDSTVEVFLGYTRDDAYQAAGQLAQAAADMQEIYNNWDTTEGEDVPDGDENGG